MSQAQNKWHRITNLVYYMFIIGLQQIWICWNIYFKTKNLHCFRDILSICQLHILLSRTAQISLELHFCVELRTKKSPAFVNGFAETLALWMNIDFTLILLLLSSATCRQRQNRKKTLHWHRIVFITHAFPKDAFLNLIFRLNVLSNKFIGLLCRLCSIQQYIQRPFI